MRYAKKVDSDRNQPFVAVKSYALCDLRIIVLRIIVFSTVTHLQTYGSETARIPCGIQYHEDSVGISHYICGIFK